MKRRFWIYALPVLLLLAVTLPHLEQGDFRIETAHYAAVGLQAWQNPALFWTPHEHPAVHYFNKPPLVFWIHGLFLHLFGITLAAVRLPGIFAAAGCVILTIGITRRLSGRAVALLTGCIMALSYEFFRRSREICLDMWQLLFMLAAAWIWIAAAKSPRRNLFWLAGIPLGLALMCKPLMALMLLPILLGWLLIGRQHGERPSLIPILAVTITSLLVALPWHASMIQLYGDSFVRQYFGHEVVARLQGHRNREPVWYYAIEIGRSYWPWMISLFAGLFHWWRGSVSRHHRQMLWLASVWVGLWAVGLTLFPDKRPRYELPLYPMLAMISAYGIATWGWRPLRHWYQRGLPLTALLVVALSLAIHLLPLQFQKPPEKNLTALVDWARLQDRTRVVSAALTAIDESTVFLKAGYWPTPLSLAPKPLKPGSLVIYSDSFPWKPPASARPVFNQGPYHVVEISSMPSKD
jgi:4-amino-4-deoxy-L-arabinose transferase-like glycosyltransferase